MEIPGQFSTEIDNRPYERAVSADTGHSPRLCRTGQIDPEPTLNIGLMKAREAPESGLWLKAWVAPL
jgi:hypothetical protein